MQAFIFFFLSTVSLVFLVGTIRGHWLSCRSTIWESVDWDRKRKTAPKNGVFVAYSTPYFQTALTLKETLVTEGLNVVMWNPDLPFKDPIDVVFDLIDSSSFFLLVNSPDNSNWLKAERELAEVTKKVIIEISSSQEFNSLAKYLRDFPDPPFPYYMPPWVRHQYVSKIFFSRSDIKAWKTEQARNFRDVQEAQSGPIIAGAMIGYGLSFYSGLIAFFLAPSSTHKLWLVLLYFGLAFGGFIFMLLFKPRRPKTGTPAK